MTEYRCGSGSTLHALPRPAVSHPCGTPVRHACVASLCTCVLLPPPLAWLTPLSIHSHPFRAAGVALFTCPHPPPDPPDIPCRLPPPSRYPHVQPARSWLPFGLGSPSSAISVAAASSTSSAPRTLFSTKRAESWGGGRRAGGYHSLLHPPSMHTAAKLAGHDRWFRLRCACGLVVDCL